MAKAKITIIGEIENFKVHEDGTVNIIIKADTSTTVANGLKELGSSTYNITVSQKMWKKISDKLPGNRIILTGEPKAAVTVKGTPFTLVNCFDISVIEQNVKESQSEHKKAEPSKPVQPLKNEVQEIKPLDKKDDSPEVPTKTKKSKNKYVNYDADALGLWRKNHTDVQDIRVADLELTEEEHLRGFDPSGYTNFKGFIRSGIKSPIIVRPLDNGKFSLVVGFRVYVIAKILNYETLPAIITELNHHSLIGEAREQIKIMEEEVATAIETVKITT